MAVTTTNTTGGATAARTSLRDAVTALATKTDAAPVDRVLRVVGPVLMPLGLLVMVLGWYGAANTTRVFLQIPYLISGGMIGLGLTFAGGFVYFSRWITDLIDDGRLQAAANQELANQTAATLGRIETLLRERPLPVEVPAAVAAVPTVPVVAAVVPERPERSRPPERARTSGTIVTTLQAGSA